MGEGGGGGETRFPCSWCGLTVVAPSGARGKGKCPRCGAVQDVPALASEPYALLPAEPPAVARPSPTPPEPARAKARAGGVRRAMIHEWAGRESVLSAEIVALLALSLADLFTTYHLLRTHPRFYESNPVAQWVFARWNIAGMAVFKLSLMAFVVTVGEVAERKRPGLGRFVLLVGCLATGAVVLHGLRLAFGELAE